MGNATSSLTLQDRMSGPLQKILKAMDNTVRVMEQMDSKTQQLDQKTLASARRSIDNATAGFARMQAQMKATNDSMSKTAQQQEKMNSALQRMKPPSVLERMRALYQGMQKEMAQATTTQQKFSTALNMLRPSNMLERLKTVMKQHGDSADNASKQQDKFNRSIEDGSVSVKGLAAGLLGAIGAYKAFNAGKTLMTDLVSRGIEFHAFRESAEVAFTTFLGDAKKAKKYMDDMYAFALKTPFAYPDLLESSRNLIAFGVAAENTFPIMQSIGDAVAAVSKPGEEGANLQNLSDIFGVIQAQGRITAMEVNRLSHYGINAFEILGSAAGKSADEMRKEISKGSVDAGFAIEALVNGMDKKFGGMMAGMKKRWSGLVDSLNSAKRNAGKAITEKLMDPLKDSIVNLIGLYKKLPQYIGPAVDAFIPLLNKLNDAFASGRFDGIFNTLASSITVVAHTLAWLGEVALWVATIFADNWSWIEPILFVTGTMLATITGILITKYAWLGAIRLATLAWAAAQWVVNAAYLANPVVLVLVLIVANIALVIYALYAWAEQTAAVVGLMVGSIYLFGQMVANVMTFIINLAIRAAEWVANTWNMGLYLIQVAMYNLNIFVRTVFDNIANITLMVAEFFMNKWNDATFSVQMAIYTMAQAGLRIMSGLASGVVGVVNSALSAVSNLINSAVSGLNKLISMVNKVPGVNISAIGTVDFKVKNSAAERVKAFSSSLTAPTKKAPVSLGRFNTAGDYMKKSAAPKPPERVALERKKYGSMTKAFKNGYKSSAGTTNKVASKLKKTLDKITGLGKGKDKNKDKGKEGPGAAPKNPFDPTNGTGKMPGGGKAPGAGKKAPGAKGGKKGNNPTGGKLDKIGKIDKEINIAEEDLKMLRDLAENKAIKTFITLNPSVNFKDVIMKEEADIDRVINKINKSFQAEFARSVEGVYE